MENHSSKNLKTKMDIDFSNKSFKVYAFIPLSIEEITSSGLFANRQNMIINLSTGEKQHIFLEKTFEISDDYNFITADNIKHQIPIFFNRDTMKLNDVKTWEMIFYQVFNTDIQKELDKYKLLIQKK